MTIAKEIRSAFLAKSLLTDQVSQSDDLHRYIASLCMALTHYHVDCSVSSAAQCARSNISSSI